MGGSTARALVLSGRCSGSGCVGREEGPEEGLSVAIHHTTSQVELTVVRHCLDIHDEIGWTNASQWLRVSVLARALN